MDKYFHGIVVFIIVGILFGMGMLVKDYVLKGIMIATACWLVIMYFMFFKSKKI